MVIQPCFEWELKRRALWYRGMLIDAPFWLQYNFFSTEYDVTTVSADDLYLSEHEIISLTGKNGVQSVIEFTGPNSSFEFIQLYI
jgi:hypothetical protein